MEFIKKYKFIFIFVGIIALFALSIALTPKDEKFVNDQVTVTEWFAKAKQDKLTVLTLGQTTCGHCINFRPVAEKFAKTYDIEWYWIDVDSGAAIQLTDDEKALIQAQFEDFAGTPYTAIMKNGKLMDVINGEAEYDEVVKTIKKVYGSELPERNK